MNPTAILALISDLYAQNDALQREVLALRQQLAEQEEQEESAAPRARKKTAVSADHG